jgi:hypothetical protein
LEELLHDLRNAVFKLKWQRTQDVADEGLHKDVEEVKKMNHLLQSQLL